MKSLQHLRSALSPRSLIAVALCVGVPLALAGAPPAAAQDSSCSLTQVTSSAEHDSYAGGLSSNGRYLALTSEADLTGGNPEHRLEVFLYDRTADSFTQLTDLAAGFVDAPVLSGDGSRVFYRTNVPPGITQPGPGDDEYLVELDLSTGEPEVVAEGFQDIAVSVDGSRAAVLSRLNPTGQNGDGNAEVFLLDLAAGTYLQITDTLQASCGGLSPRCPSNLDPRIDADGSRVAFFSDYDLDDSGAAASHGGVFVYDVPTDALSRVAIHADPALTLSDDGSTVAFASYENPAGGAQSAQLELYVEAGGGFVEVPGNRPALSNPDALDRTGSRLAFTGAPQVGNGRDAFLFDVGSGAVVPLLAAPGVDDFVTDLTPDGAWAALHSKANRSSGNPDGGFEVFLASCDEQGTMAPPPPAGEWLSSPAVPGFRFKVRITAGDAVQPVRLESACIPETACVSGALPGRSELFIRVIGPRPNGKLWPTLVRFSTSEIEVWIEQLSSGDLEYYRLPAASPGSEELNGLFDRDGFDP